MGSNGVELVWEGKRKDVERVALPFQRVEVINESRATREAGPLFRTGAGPQLPADPLWTGADGATPWRNKLIWGDNKYVLASLLEGDKSIGLEPLAGKVDLIYIDPPFATGADFSYDAEIGDVEIRKKATAVEEVAYRDTWGEGLASYFQRLYEALLQSRDLLAPTGSLFLHLGVNISGHARPLLSEVFGDERFTNEIIWKRSAAHSDSGQGATHLGRLHDVVFWYRKTDASKVRMQYEDYSDEYVNSAYKHVEPGTGRRYQLDNTSGPGGARKGNPHFEFMGVQKYWRYSRERVERLYAEGRLIKSKTGTDFRYKRYLDEMPGLPLQDVWTDIPPLQSQSGERTGYETQKPEKLMNRIVALCSDDGDLVLDYFAGSGTTMVSAEKLGRRWIGCDLGRFATHTSRKRLLGIAGCKPFEVLNLGRYERRHWQGIHAGEAIWEYFRFIVELYSAEPISGFAHLHGRKGPAMVHVGATDAPVTEAEVAAALEECEANGFGELHVLGWEWEMSLNAQGLQKLVAGNGVEARLFHIPNEVMDKRAVEAGDIRFFEAAALKAAAVFETKRTVRIELKDFIVAVDDYIRQKTEGKVKKWSDWIDYWAVDFEYRGDVFHNQWQAYRTRKSPALELVSGAHKYGGAGKRDVLVKVVDIFGNDTTALVEVAVE